MEKREHVDPPPASGPGQPGQTAQELWQRWRQGQGPTLQEVLAHAGELTAGQLAVAIAADQYQNWQQGKRPRAEEYLQQYPALCADEEAACNLVYGEFLLQQELGEAPSLQEYLDRFPQLADGLQQLRAVQQRPALAPAGRPYAVGRSHRPEGGRAGHAGTLGPLPNYSPTRQGQFWRRLSGLRRGAAA